MNRIAAGLVLSALLSVPAALAADPCGAGSQPRLAIAFVPDPYEYRLAPGWDESRFPLDRVFIWLEEAEEAGGEGYGLGPSRAVPAPGPGRVLLGRGDSWGAEELQDFTARAVSIEGLRVAVGDAWVIAGGAGWWRVRIGGFAVNWVVGEEGEETPPRFDSLYAWAPLPADLRRDLRERIVNSEADHEFLLAAPFRSRRLGARAASPAPPVETGRWAEDLRGELPAWGAEAAGAAEIRIQPLRQCGEVRSLAVLTVPARLADGRAESFRQARIYGVDGEILWESGLHGHGFHLVVSDVDRDGSEEVGIGSRYFHVVRAEATRVVSEEYWEESNE